MLFMATAYLKPGFEQQLINFRDDLNEHFAQPVLKVAGVLRDSEGRKKGYMGFIEADSFEEAEGFVRQGPFYREHLYERLEISQCDVVVGQLA